MTRYISPRAVFQYKKSGIMVPVIVIFKHEKYHVVKLDTEFRPIEVIEVFDHKKFSAPEIEQRFNYLNAPYDLIYENQITKNQFESFMRREQRFREYEASI